MTPQELKNSILQLAIQGKLVEQRPEEGTAAELLRDILTQRRVTAPCGWPQPVGTRPSRAEREPRDAEVGRSPRDRRVSARNGGRGATALPRVIENFKHLLSSRYGLRFQRDFFDTRLRDDAHFAEKYNYILGNRVKD